MDSELTELRTAPKRGTVMRRAIRSSLRRRDGTPVVALPTAGLALRNVDVDIDRLAAYDRVCGYRLANALPITYPHVLAFPLAMQLMSSPDFPFAVIGLLHVADRITQGRPIQVGEKFDLAVRAAALRPHDRGQQFDVIATATVDGVEVWHSESTYLRRDATKPEAKAPAASDGSSPVDGAGDAPTGRAPGGGSRELPNGLPPTAVWRVLADTGRAYAAVSGDRNPIHVSRVGARAFGFPRPIAHGMWTMAHAVAALEGRLADTYTVDVAFRRPVLLPSTVEWRAHRDREGWTVAVTDPKSGKPHLTGSIAPA